MLERQAGEADMGVSGYEDWTEYGGWKRRNWLRERDFLRAVRKMGVGGWDPLGYFQRGPDCVVARVTAVWTAWRNGWTGCRTGESCVWQNVMSFMKSGRLSGGEKEMYAAFEQANLYRVSERNGMRSGSACFPDS